MLTPKQPVINAVLITHILYLITQLRKITGWRKKKTCFLNNCNFVYF